MRYIWIWRPIPACQKFGFSRLNLVSLVERHHARVELLDDVVEVHFGGFLVVVRGCPMGELRLGILAEDLELDPRRLFSERG